MNGGSLTHLPGRLTLATTIALPAAAAALVVGGVPPNWAPYVERTAEFAAFFSLILAWRFRRSRLLTLAESKGTLDPRLSLIASPQATHLAFLIATAFILVAYTMKRGIFENGMSGVLGSCALAVFGPRLYSMGRAVRSLRR